jgi:hypothetical protein
VRKFEVKLPLGRTGLCWSLILKLILRIGWEDIDWIDLAQDRKSDGPL